MKKILVGLLIVGFLIGFAPAIHAADEPLTLETLKQQLIALIIQQIQILQAQLDEILATQATLQNTVDQQSQTIQQ